MAIDKGTITRGLGPGKGPPIYGGRGRNEFWEGFKQSSGMTPPIAIAYLLGALVRTAAQVLIVVVILRYMGVLQ